MENNRQTFWEKVARQVSGNASEADRSWLLQQKGQDLASAESWEEAERVWEETGSPPDAYTPNVDTGWQRFQLKVQARETQQLPRRNRAPLWAAAAMVAMLVLIGFFYLNQTDRQTWVEVRTAAHETRVLALADGSRVTLNGNTTFSYPDNFLQENRTVRLEGEAFFEVAKAEGKRFTVFANGSKTEVIGTSFNIRAYDKDPVHVHVVTGKVAFAKAGTEEAVFLMPGQEGVLAPQARKPMKQGIENPNDVAWKTRNLSFRNQPLDQLAEDLERYFGINVSFDNQALRNCRFTTSFQDPELQEVLDILALTGNLTITKNGSRYIFSGKGCN